MIVNFRGYIVNNYQLISNLYYKNLNEIKMLQ